MFDDSLTWQPFIMGAFNWGVGWSVFDGGVSWALLEKHLLGAFDDSTHLR